MAEDSFKTKSCAKPAALYGNLIEVGCAIAAQHLRRFHAMKLNPQKPTVIVEIEDIDPAE